MNDQDPMAEISQTPPLPSVSSRNDLRERVGERGYNFYRWGIIFYVYVHNRP